MSNEQTIELSLEQVDDYEFRVRFAGAALEPLHTDEAPPLGHDAGPNPSRLLTAAVANCLAASLLFSLHKFKNDPGKLSAHARATLERNSSGRLRVGRISVELGMTHPAASMQHLERLLAQFEDFCIVTQSVRQGIAVEVSVRDGEGKLLHMSAAA